MEEQKNTVAVIGAGIIGLSTAIRLQDILGNDYSVVVFANLFLKDTVSDVAAGIWCPSGFGNTPMEKIIDWGKRTWNYLKDILATPDHADKGVCFTPYYYFYNEPGFKRHDWADIFASYDILEKDEAQRINPKAQAGILATTIVAESGRMMDYLLKKFVSRGGICIKRSVQSFDELSAEGYDLIVNCSGIGAKELCSDQDVYPIRGQIREVIAPWIRMAMSNGSSYIFPKGEVVVLGVVDTVGDWCQDVRDEETEYIMTECCKMDPALKNALVVADRVGLRPGRTEVRLELEQRHNCSIIHNYGHGGSGLTLFWGCAEDAAALALNVIRHSPRHRL